MADVFPSLRRTTSALCVQEEQKRQKKWNGECREVASFLERRKNAQENNQEEKGNEREEREKSEE